LSPAIIIITQAEFGAGQHRFSALVSDPRNHRQGVLFGEEFAGKIF
jgi:hypothetical protein